MSKQEQATGATFGQPIEHVLPPSLISAALSGTPQQIAEHVVMRPAFEHELITTPEVQQEFARWDARLGLLELRAEIRDLYENGGTVDATTDDVGRRLKSLPAGLPPLASEFVARLGFPWLWLARDLCDFFVLRVGDLGLSPNLEIEGSIREIPRETTIFGTTAERLAQLEQLIKAERQPKMRRDTPGRIRRQAQWLVQYQVQGISHYQLSKRSGYNQTQIERAIDAARRCLEVATFS
jgi:hypothetical protein